ncbi:MAG: flagellar FliJ family protein [Alphaproteobacteria bacterium]|nr:flagellar FliJ family protein [Alphaproteobacteria bacterium]
MKGLAALIRLHTWRLDEKRRELADLQRLEDQFLEDGRRLQAEVAAEQEFAKTSDGGAFSYGGFAIGVIERRKRIEASIAEVRRRIDDKRAEVAEAFQELKRYEITQAERLKRERAEADRRNQADLDEISLTQYQRRAKE